MIKITKSRAFISLILTIFLLCTFVIFDLSQKQSFAASSKANLPISDELHSIMKLKGMKARSPILIRIFKKEYELEVWKESISGEYDLLKTFKICNWGKGKLGPKIREGDGQAPEGFYNVAWHQMKPNSSYHLAFNLGFPNKFDRSHNRTGSNLMVHGKCKSVGCFAMTDENIEEIYSLAREAFKGGQKIIQVHAYPFHMTKWNLIQNYEKKHMIFWNNLKDGYDLFNNTKKPLKINVSGRNYIFENTIDYSIPQIARN